MLAEGIFKDQVFLISGAGTGIGRGFALRAAHLGATIALAGRRAELLQSVADEIEAAGGKSLVCPLDIRQPAQVEDTVEKVVTRFGRLDTLINNAAGNFVVRAEDLSPNGWNAVINTVLNGTAYCTISAGRQMLKQGRGKVLSISAAYAWYGGPGTAHSAAAKAGVIALSQTLAVEWGLRNVRSIACALGSSILNRAEQRSGQPRKGGVVSWIPCLPAGSRPSRKWWR